MSSWLWSIHCYSYLSRLGFTLFRRKNLMKRIRVLCIARNRWGVWTFQTDWGRGFSGMFYKIFDRSTLVPCKNSRREYMKIYLKSYKTGIVPPINFNRTRIKDQIVITRIKSCSNLIICLVSCCQHTWTSRTWRFLCLLSYLQG